MRAKPKGKNDNGVDVTFLYSKTCTKRQHSFRKSKQTTHRSKQRKSVVPIVGTIRGGDNSGSGLQKASNIFQQGRTQMTDSHLLPVINNDGSHPEKFPNRTIGSYDTREIEEITFELPSRRNSSEVQELTPELVSTNSSKMESISSYPSGMQIKPGLVLTNSSEIQNVKPELASTNSAEIEIIELDVSPASTNYSPVPQSNGTNGAASFEIVDCKDSESSTGNNSPYKADAEEVDFVYKYLDETFMDASTSAKVGNCIDQEVEDHGEGTSQKVSGPDSIPSPDNSSSSQIEQNDSVPLPPQVLKSIETESFRKEAMRKKNHLAQIVEAVKVVLRPYYKVSKVTKEEYKEILGRAVSKIRQSRSRQINPTKITILVRDYVRNVRARRRKEKLSEQAAS